MQTRGTPAMQRQGGTGRSGMIGCSSQPSVQDRGLVSWAACFGFHSAAWRSSGLRAQTLVLACSPVPQQGQVHASKQPRQFMPSLCTKTARLMPVLGARRAARLLVLCCAVQVVCATRQAHGRCRCRAWSREHRLRSLGHPTEDHSKVHTLYFRWTFDAKATRRTCQITAAPTSASHHGRRAPRGGAS
jgi:hypothetical protein